MQTKNIKVGAFTYGLRIHPQAGGSVVFDVVDQVTIKGEVSPDIIFSGKIDLQGRLKINELYCDLHAAHALGEIILHIYEMSYKFLE